MSSINCVDYAQNLHASLQREIKSNGFDTFGNRYIPYADPLLLASKETAIGMDTRMIDKANGPTDIRERFTSNYWHKWNRDLSLLEDLSRRDMQKQIIIPKARLRSKKRYKGKGASFASPLDNPDNKIVALKAATSVKDIITGSLGQKVTTYHPLVHGVLDPYSIGLGHVKGGASSSADAHPVAGIQKTTSMCDLPPVDKVRSERGAGKFLSASTGRAKSFVTASIPEKLAHAGSDFNDRAATAVYDLTGRGQGTQFSRGARFNEGDDMKGDMTPGPGSYSIPRLFEDHSRPTTNAIQTNPPSSASLDSGLQLSRLRPIDLSAVVGFGFGCDRQQHILYGMCLDGMCGKRATWEKIIVRGNDVSRAVGMSPDDDVFLSEVTLPTIEGMTALHAAVCRNDFDAIRRLHFAVKQVNKLDSQSGLSPLHAIAQRRELQTLEVFMEVFGKHVNINLPNSEGDTALHIACRSGYEDIVCALCDYGANPTICANSAGQYPLDIAKLHAIHQVLHIQITAIELANELAYINGAVT